MTRKSLIPCTWQYCRDLIIDLALCSHRFEMKSSCSPRSNLLKNLAVVLRNLMGSLKKIQHRPNRINFYLSLGFTRESAIITGDFLTAVLRITFRFSGNDSIVKYLWNPLYICRRLRSAAHYDIISALKIQPRRHC